MSVDAYAVESVHNMLGWRLTVGSATVLTTAWLPQPLSMFFLEFKFSVAIMFTTCVEHHITIPTLQLRASKRICCFTIFVLLCS